MKSSEYPKTCSINFVVFCLILQIQNSSVTFMFRGIMDAIKAGNEISWFLSPIQVDTSFNDLNQTSVSTSEILNLSPSSSNDITTDIFDYQYVENPSVASNCVHDLPSELFIPNTMTHASPESINSTVLFTDIISDTSYQKSENTPSLKLNNSPILL